MLDEPKLRELTPEEWKLVSGGYMTENGGIGVDGSRHRYDFDWKDYYWWDFGGGNDDNSEDFGNGQGNDDWIDEPTPHKMTDTEKEKLVNTLEGIKSILEENIKKYGGDALIKLHDGTNVKATDVLDALGKTIDLLESANIAWDIVNKNADVIEVAAFVASIAGGAVAGALGAGPIAVFVASTAAGIATKEGLELFEQQWDKAWKEAFAAVSDPRSNQTENMVQFFRDLFKSSPSNPFNDRPFDSDPFAYYNGPGYKNWLA